MNDQEQNDFKQVFGFYDRWRSVILETDDQWLAFGKDAGETSTRITQNLGWKLLMAAIDAISDMYKNGRKPMPAGYFGRDDL
ncbi:MAG: hypothetical protein II008_10745 [Oscillospiraceae bacterium]|jgi:hypothetical protein|nr:hypothetical protein [Oscillospiraceae bacterium]